MKQGPDSEKMDIDKYVDGLLFDFWHTIPTVIQIDKRQTKVLKNTVRRQILDALELGINDIHPETNKIQIRHALNANEILEYFVKNLNEADMNLSKLYFHLGKLENEKIVSIIAIKKERNITIRYYGRVAKTFLQSNHVPAPSVYKELIDVLPEIFRVINFDMDDKEYQEQIDSLKPLTQPLKLDKRVTDWMEEHSEVLNHFSIDFRKIYTLVELLQWAKPENYKLLSDFFKNMGLEIN